MQPTPLRKVVGTYSVIRGEWFLSAESRVVASRQLIVVFTCGAMSHGFPPSLPSHKRRSSSHDETCARRAAGVQGKEQPCTPCQGWVVPRQSRVKLRRRVRWGPWRPAAPGVARGLHVGEWFRTNSSPLTAAPLHCRHVLSADANVLGATFPVPRRTLSLLLTRFPSGLPHSPIAAALAGRERTQCAARPMPAWMPASRDSQRCGDARCSTITAHRSPTHAAVVMRTRSSAIPLQHPLPSGAVRFQHPSHATSLHVIVRGVLPRSAGPVRFRGYERSYGGRFTEWASEPVDPRRNGHGWPAVATHSWDARRQIPATELPDAQGIGRGAQFGSDVRKRHRGAVACKQVLLAARSHRNRVRDCNGEFVVFGLHDDCPIPEQPPRQG